MTTINTVTHPTVHISVLQPEQIIQLEPILGFRADALEHLKTLALYSIKSDPTIMNCPVPMISYDDVSGNPMLEGVYQQLYGVYGDKLDTIIPKDQDIIRSKVTNILTFAMDKVFKCGTIDVIITPSPPVLVHRRGSLPITTSLVLKSVMEDFDYNLSGSRAKVSGKRSTTILTITKKEEKA